jgi:hypothetical protein
MLELIATVKPQLPTADIGFDFAYEVSPRAVDGTAHGLEVEARG